MCPNQHQELIELACSLPLQRSSIVELYARLCETFGLARAQPDPNPCRGRWLAFDGHSGAGKDTQLLRLEQTLGKNHPHLTVEVLVMKRADPFRALAKQLWSLPPSVQNTQASFLLLSAGRIYLQEHLILPRLSTPDHVLLLNRSYLSHIAYHAIEPTQIPELLQLCEPEKKPDCCFVLECAMAAALARVQQRAIEKAGRIYANERPEFISRVRQNFRAIQRLAPNVVAVETTGPIEQIAGQIYNHFRTWC